MSQNNPIASTKSRKPDSRPARTKAELRAALTRMLAVRPFEEILVREITTEAGISQATFFRHYSDKAALLDDVIQQFLDDISAPIKFLVESNGAKETAIHLCRFVDNNRITSTALFAGGASAIVLEKFVSRALELAGSFPENRTSKLPGRLALIFPVNTIVTILTWWLKEMEEMKPEEVADIINNLVLHPLSIYL